MNVYGMTRLVAQSGRSRGKVPSILFLTLIWLGEIAEHLVRS